MNAQLNLADMGLTAVSFEDASLIDGGDFSSGYAAGVSAGQATMSFLKGVNTIISLVRNLL